MDLATLKTARTTSKRNLTLKLNAAKVSLAEGQLADIDKVELIGLYRNFIKSHQAYEIKALDEEAEEQEDLDLYLFTEQEKYTKVMSSIRNASSHAETSPERSKPSSDITREELLGVLSLNTAEYLKPHTMVTP